MSVQGKAREPRYPNVSLKVNKTQQKHQEQQGGCSQGPTRSFPTPPGSPTPPWPPALVCPPPTPYPPPQLQGSQERRWGDTQSPRDCRLLAEKGPQDAGEGAEAWNSRHRLALSHADPGQQHILSEHWYPHSSKEGGVQRPPGSYEGQDSLVLMVWCLVWDLGPTPRPTSLCSMCSVLSQELKGPS